MFNAEKSLGYRVEPGVAPVIRSGTMSDNTRHSKGTVVTGTDRGKFLPRVFGNVLRGLEVESRVFSAARRLFEQYRGGSWDFVKIAGGGYMAPSGEATRRLRVSVNSNGFDGELSFDAAGVVATMFAINGAIMAAHDRGDDAAQEVLCDRYYALRDYAIEHPEHRAILGAID